jgi:hypothetical protein
MNGKDGKGQYNTADIIFEEYRDALYTDMGMDTKIDTVH